MEIFSDSRLVVGQVKGELEARDMRMQDYLSQVRHLQLGLSPFPYNKSQGAKTHMPTPLPPSQSPRHSVYLESSLSKTCISLPSSKRRGSLFTKLGWGLVRWTPLCCFSRMTSCPRRKGKLIRCGEKLIGSSCLRIKSCISAPFLGLICYVSILKQ